MRRVIALAVFFLLLAAPAFSQNDELDKKVQEWITGEGTFDTRIEEIESLILAAKNQNRTDLTANLFRMKGALMYRHGDMEKGLEAILESLKLSRDQPNSATYIAGLSGVSNIYYRLGELEKAKVFAKEAISLISRAREKDEMTHAIISVCALNLAQMYYEQDSLLLSSEYLDISSLHLRLTEDTSDICDLHVMQGAIEHKSGKYKKAEDRFRQALSCAVSAKELHAHYSALSNLGQLYTDMKMLDSAIHFFSEALSVSYLIEDPVLIKESAADLSFAYEIQGDSAAAFQFLKVSRLFSDSLLDQTRIQALIDAEQKYENETKSLLLARQQETLKNRQRLLIFMIVLAAVLILLIVLVILNRNKSRQLARQELKIKDSHITELLQEQEVRNVDAMLKGQDSERQRIARELHDRIGSMLSAIKLHSSSVGEQLKKLPDVDMKVQDQVVSMLDEAVNEVRKISHDLYSASLVKFGMKAALLQLIQSIESSNKINISFLDNGVLPSDYQSYEVELYRITQELIANTLKYAGAGEVVIQLNKTDAYLVYSYEDNGRGFNSDKLKESEGIGYLSIQNRVKKIKGISTLDTHPGHGMTFIIEIPI